MLTTVMKAIRSSPFLRRVGRLLRTPFRLISGKQIVVTPDMDCRKQTLGNQGASFTVATDHLGPNSIVLSVGIGEDISFDRALIDQYGVEVHAFDPTPKSLEWLRSQTLPASFHAHPYGLANCDGEISFFPPRDPTHVSHSAIVRHSGPSEGVRCPVRRLETIMDMIGASRIDLLKLDIEGAEYEVLQDLAAGTVRPRQILVEYHHRFPGIGVTKTRRSIALLRSLGYAVFDVAPSGEEFSFLWRSA